MYVKIANKDLFCNDFLSHFSQMVILFNMFHQVIFAKLEVQDQLNLGLCSRQTMSSFWKCMGSKIWYNSKVFYSSFPKSRRIRKLCINLSALPKPLETLDHLTHLHIYDSTSNVRAVVLPPNLTYCFLDATTCLWQCTLPMSLKSLETQDNFTRFVNLANHPNLTVLRMPEYSEEFILPPNLVEFSIRFWADLDILPPSLVSLDIDDDIHFYDLPQSLTKLEIFNGVSIAEWRTNREKIKDY